MFVSIIAYIIDGIIIGHFLGTEAIAAFGFTVPYQKFTAIFPNIIALGMQVLCSKNLGKGDLRESNKIFSLALTFARCFFQRHGNFIGGLSRRSCLCRRSQFDSAADKTCAEIFADNFLDSDGGNIFGDTDNRGALHAQRRYGLSDDALTPHFGITGLWLSFPLSYVAFLLACDIRRDVSALRKNNLPP